MPHVHLSHIPRHVVRRKRHFESGSNALPVHFIYVLHPHGHPRSLVACFVSVFLKGGCIRSLAASALRALTKKNLALARTNPQTSAAFPNPSISASPTSQTTQNSRQCRSHSISASALLPSWREIIPPESPNKALRRLLKTRSAGNMLLPF